MSVHVIVVLLICCSGAFAEKNFWNNEVCRTDADCSGLKSCDSTFGCKISIETFSYIGFGVFLILCVIMCGIMFLCRKNFRNVAWMRPFPFMHNQYLPQTVITTNQNPWNQQMGTTTTTVYPCNPQPNQFYGNTVNQPMLNQPMYNQPMYNQPMYNQQMDTGMGVTLSLNQAPNAPYAPAGFGYGQAM